MLFMAFAPYGVFALESEDSKNGEYSIEDLKYYKIFEEGEIPEIMRDLRKGNFEIVEELKKEWNVEDKEMVVELSSSEPNIAGKLIRKNLYELGVKFGVFSSHEEFIEKMNSWSLGLTKSLMKKSSEQKDKLVVQTVNALDNLDETLNLFSERLREWYSLYFPEMDKLVKKHEIYINLISDFSYKDNFTRTRLKKTLPSNLARTLALAAKESMGAEISEEDLQVLKNLAEEVKRLYECRENLQKYLESAMEDVAPNLTAVGGASLGARLISLAGGIDRLSKLPASTIQVIGAEKALFAHLREHASPPKHGVIYQHPLIQSSKWWAHGKIARALACKLSIAVRADVYGHYIAEDLLEQLNKRVEEISKKYPNPPKKKKAGRREPKKAEGGRRREGKGKGNKGKRERKGGKKDRVPKEKGKPKGTRKKDKKSKQEKPKEDVKKKKIKMERRVIGKTSSQN